MRRRESSDRKRKKKAQRRDVKVSRVGYTIKEFCEAHRISEPTYFRMQALGLGPRIMKALGRTIITNEAASDWRHARESAATGT
jgi:hypothetical protein